MRNERTVRGGNEAAPPPTPRYEALLESARSTWWDSRNFDKWKSHYLSEYARGRSILALLAERAPELRIEGTRVLDVGCGDAGVAIAFAEAGARAFGIEPFELSVERGRVRAEEHGVTVDLRVGVAEELPYERASFDLVLLDNVLEHVQDRERTLDEIDRVLRPGGLLYLVTPKPFAIHSLVSDPHYGMAGLVLMPRPVQKWYFERVRGGGQGNYGVGWIPTRRWVLSRLRARGFELLAPPRDLWIRYLRERIGDPAALSSPLKRRVARWVAEHPAATGSPVAAAFWDVALGANIFLARKRS
ncbi:MAG TPA: class I SAM-dependent methyltransferase [Longimicrobiaceae bacterium]